ncbi:helix-turn-helix domain-containing protein [Herbiconiux sp. KACC 21604]|uniref:IclR family transcriptional regulator n=1 Tax=unclassified Herbiconiux TaxID=2618217 RepID=UPI0014930102|nr:helix-turn-helix domain-containing protein [Herbiconiux sp. SALV-R1]QJU54480.1 helix-turn-helix domain-containing protein [Herbiconiux sp. SALV-R1]WPO85558.1 helix-turn-helix domain-containing protein [Herbiconiux sp. KACC 21604]
MPPEYAVPALEKALDIIEVLAGRESGLSQLEIAQAVERSPSQIFRVLTTLERRGYLARDRQTGLYSLSMRLFDLVHRQEPTRTLVAAAAGPMRRLADAVGQSCNLSVVDVDRLRVVAQAESPADFGFRVRVGAEFSLVSTATGAVLSAFGAYPDAAPEAVDSVAAARIRELGYLERADPVQPSITDLVLPIVNRDGRALAALTVPYVSTSYSAIPRERVVDAARETADEISANLGF